MLSSLRYDFLLRLSANERVGQEEEGGGGSEEDCVSGDSGSEGRDDGLGWKGEEKGEAGAREGEWGGRGEIVSEGTGGNGRLANRLVPLLWVSKGELLSILVSINTSCSLLLTLL